jgi:hypothetical protein
MATTGTYGFSPSAGECSLAAFERLGIFAPNLSAQHMQSARREANFLAVEWSNKGPNLWDVDLQSVPLVPGTATYAVPSNTVTILDAYLTVTDTAGNSTDRILLPISRSEYATYPNKAMQSPPTVYWYDKLIAPTITLWAVPDGGATYTLNYYRYRRIQDTALSGAATPEVPFLWLDAFVAGLSHRLSRIYAQPLEMARKGDAVEAYGIAATQNTEDADLYVTPMLGSYYR